MKAVEYGKAAASAEARRLQSIALRYGLRVAFLVVAALFGLFTLISAHVTLWVICYGPWHTGKVWASLIVLALDILLTGVFVLLGRGKQPSVAEIEARMTRDRNLTAMKNAVALSTVTATVVGPAGRMAGRSIVGALRGRWSRRRSVFRSR